MRAVAALVLVAAVGIAAYAAGRLQAKVSYRFGYRFGYRQGYFDGDRAGWNRRRREAQAAVESALNHWQCGVTTALPIRPVSSVPVAAPAVAGPAVAGPAVAGPVVAGPAVARPAVPAPPGVPVGNPRHVATPGGLAGDVVSGRPGGGTDSV